MRSISVGSMRVQQDAILRQTCCLEDYLIEVKEGASSIVCKRVGRKTDRLDESAKVLPTLTPDFCLQSAQQCQGVKCKQPRAPQSCAHATRCSVSGKIAAITLTQPSTSRRGVRGPPLPVFVFVLFTILLQSFTTTTNATK